MKKYIYIVQAVLEPAKCKVGITNNLDRRLKEYNSTTGVSKDNSFRYLFAAEVQNAEEMEKEFKKNFAIQREERSREIYFYNTPLFSGYLEWIRGHAGFVREVVCKEKKERGKSCAQISVRTKKLKDAGLTYRDVLERAKSAKNDEWYTLYEDIEKEVSMYPAEVWKNKVVFCNCDDAVDRKNDNNTSNFALFFIRNFQKLGLKKLICTHFAGKVDLFNAGSRAYVFTKDGFTELTDFPKDYNGSFDHPYSLKILNEESDIVCTNPPFSLKRQYLETVIGSGKKFLVLVPKLVLLKGWVIANMARGLVWAGHNRVDWFLDPKGNMVTEGCVWATNLPIENRAHSNDLKIEKVENIPEKSKKIDDSGTLLVNDNWIPMGYKKPFAVSVHPILSGVLEKGYSIKSSDCYDPRINGKIKFSRILIQKDPVVSRK